MNGYTVLRTLDVHRLNKNSVRPLILTLHKDKLQMNQRLQHSETLKGLEKKSRGRYGKIQAQVKTS